jgi:hypothetical protein
MNDPIQEQDDVLVRRLIDLYFQNTQSAFKEQMEMAARLIIIGNTIYASSMFGNVKTAIHAAKLKEADSLHLLQKEQGRLLSDLATDLAMKGEEATTAMTELYTLFKETTQPLNPLGFKKELKSATDNVDEALVSYAQNLLRFAPKDRDDIRRELEGILASKNAPMPAGDKAPASPPPAPKK